VASLNEGADVLSATRNFLTFWVKDRCYALPADEVREIIEMPAMTTVPQAPAALLGVANLRGVVLPVASLSVLLGLGASTSSRSSRAIVLDVVPPLAIAVEAIGALVNVEASRIQTKKDELNAGLGDNVAGMFPIGTGSHVARIVEVGKLLSRAFAQRKDVKRTHRTVVDRSSDAGEIVAQTRHELVTFDVAGQEFALDLEVVGEILPLPATTAAIPRAETPVLGVMTLRDRLLPLFSLRALLGFSIPRDAHAREKVIVTRIFGTRVGLVADQARAVIAADPALIDPLPPVLAARLAGESRLRAVYRGDEGRRIIGILAADHLFREETLQRLGSSKVEAELPASEAAHASGNEISVVVFRLGSDEFALPVESVDEVAEVPSEIRRLPRTPKFLEGVINLRGAVLPVIDQRRRFDMPEPGEPLTSRRLMVVRSGPHRAGLIVDAVSDVLRVPAAAVKPPPELTEEITRLVHGVVNLQGTGRIILLLDSAELLTRAERGLLEKFQAQATPVSA